MTDRRETTLIVGGTGLVGRMLSRIWAGREDIAFQHRGGSEGPEWDVLNGPNPILRWMDKNKPRTLVALAGVTPGASADMELNVQLTDACLEAALQGGVERVLYASSSAVYGPGTGQPFTEASPTFPANDYGKAKLDAEASCAQYREKGLSVCTLRIGNITGTDQLCRNAGKATSDAPLSLDRFADGHGPRRSYIAPSTFAAVLETLWMAWSPPSLLNVGAPGPVAMEALLGASKAPWEWVTAPETALQDVTLDCTALSALHPFRPEDSDPDHMVADWHRWAQ